MRLLLAFILFLVSERTLSQLPAHYIRSYGSTGSDGGSAVCNDANGNTYATGYFSGTMMADSSTYLSSSGGSDIYIIKNDVVGNLIWAIKAGGTGSDKPSDIVCDDSGNIYITGYFSGISHFGTQTVTSDGLQDFFIAKYDSTGSLIWVRKGGGGFQDEGKKLDFDPAGNCIVTGTFSGTATFGSSPLISMNNTITGLPSIDLFIAFYSAAGNLIWIKHGSSEYTVQGAGISFDNGSSIYVTGQFSDTIAFSNSYPNNMYNSGFLMKLDYSGNEIWFRKIGGGNYNFIQDVAVSAGGKILTTGYFKGSPFIDTSPPVTISTNHNYGVFLIQWDSDGSVEWIKTFGSECYLDSKAISFDQSSNIYLGGNYKCKLDEFSDSYGEGAFNSVGFQDIFVAKFDINGTFVWARNYGGQLEDYLTDISINSYDQPLITGKYENRLMFPVIHNQNFNLLSYGNVGLPTAYYPTMCNEEPDWKMFHVVSKGATDAFLAKPCHPLIQPYYYYYNIADIGCARPFVNVEISQSHSEDRSVEIDTIESCFDIRLAANSNTSRTSSFGSQNTNSPGPRFTYLWSTGETTRDIQPQQSGTFWVRLTSLDSCFSSVDTVVYIKHSLPSKPKMSDSQGVNVLADSTQTLNLCKPDSVQFTVHTDPAYQITWLSTPVINDSTSITISQANNYLTNFFVGSSLKQYTCRVTDENGCYSNNFIRVNIDSALPVIQPRMMLFHPVTGNPLLSDTLRVCDLTSRHIEPNIYDTLKGLPPGHLLCYNATHLIPYASYSWSLTPSPTSSYSSSCFQSHYFIVNSSGWYTVNCIMTRQSPCPGTPSDTFLIQKSIYILIDPTPQVTAQISGNNMLCPGDSLQLTGSGGAYYKWYYDNVDPQNFISDLPQIFVNDIGTYILIVSDTNQFGCFRSATDFFDVYGPSQPVLTVSPSNAILCPGDSVAITCNANGNYTWYGPNGIIGSNTPIIYVSQTGLYYCDFDSAGCSSTSLEVSITGYATPELTISPGEVLCPGDELTLDLFVSNGSLVQWLSPLSGSALQQVIAQPGVYACQVISCGITTIDSVIVTASNAIATVQPAGPVNLCEGSVITLTANPGMAFYQWQPAFSYGPELTTGEAGLYSLMTTDNFGCNAFSDTVEINLIAPPQAPLLFSNNPVCTGDSLSILALYDSTLSFYWTLPNGNQSSDSGFIFYEAYTIHSGIYIATQSDGNCSASDTIIILVDTLFYNGLTMQGSACIGEYYQIETEPYNTNTYQWTSPDNSIHNGPKRAFSSLEPEDVGYYILNITSAVCTLSDSIFVNPESCTEEMTNVFTPNGDGLNDTFVFQNLRPGAIGIIVNRWGEKVFETDSREKHWDGTNMNTKQNCPEGAYFYYVRSAGFKDPEIDQGAVLLIR